MKKQSLLVVLSFLLLSVNAQVYKTNGPLVHTYSIVARDSVTGEMAVAVQSHWLGL